MILLIITSFAVVGVIAMTWWATGRESERRHAVVMAGLVQRRVTRLSFPIHGEIVDEQRLSEAKEELAKWEAKAGL